ncbi:uncharacterized protein LOC128720931 [Anopheles nili]|uniref:uncharacterized protein LOC128720931 n=1 Tax=Anopheles nili TaxID=185578 RepID=UPI00237C05DC|nr:uncharacterized protein LOC128720931 [Anopheles nili]
MATRGWKVSQVPVQVLLVLLAVLLVPIRGEMRKSWQAKSGDVQAQLLKAARFEDVPGTEAPTPKDLPDDRPLEPSTSTLAPSTTAPEPSVKPQALFSSRVRNKSTIVSAPVPSNPSVLESTGGRDVPLTHPEQHPEEVQVDDATVQDDDDDEDDDDEDDVLGWGKDAPGHERYDLIENILEEVEARVSQDDKPDKDEPPVNEKPTAHSKEYTFPPVLNMTIDEPNNIVRVKLNQDVVREMLSTGRQAGGGIGGKKMLRYVLPLFILPFLIQSAVIPFMLTAVKLFLLKSLMAGKLAIFLLLLGAFKNFTKKDRDVYVKDLPDRRYEPSSEGFAYLAEGRPSGWVN